MKLNVDSRRMERNLLPGPELAPRARQRPTKDLTLQINESIRGDCRLLLGSVRVLAAGPR